MIAATKLELVTFMDLTKSFIAVIGTRGAWTEVIGAKFTCLEASTGMDILLAGLAEAAAGDEIEANE